MESASLFGGPWEPHRDPRRWEGRGWRGWVGEAAAAAAAAEAALSQTKHSGERLNPPGCLDA